MTADKVESLSKTFHYSFPTCTNEEILYNLEVPIEIPYDGCTRELVQRVINMFRIPIYLEDDLNISLAAFVQHETTKYHNDRDEKLLNQLKNNLNISLAAFVQHETTKYHNDRDEKLLNQLKNSEIDVEGLIKNWEKAFKDNIVEYAEQKGTSDEEVFAAAYHKLVHSTAVETILQVENSYANTVASTLKNRDDDIKKLTKSQTEEMEEKVSQLNTFTTEEDINDLAAKHFEEQSLLAGRWGSQVDALWQTQRSEYRAWLMKTLEEYQSSSALNTPSNSPLATFSVNIGESRSTPLTVPRRQEDSFTIHLGSQLKQTHNVRILAAHALDLVLHHTDPATEASRRLQTALGLYSSELCGLVLLCDSPPYRPSDVTRRFIDICRSSTEHHCSDIDKQLRIIHEDMKEPLEQRCKQEERQDKSSKQKWLGMRTGDVFVTKHSNLPDTHVVFHMMAEDSQLKSGDINSRHPAILGLRNILKMACSNDVTSISLPVLLRHDMADEMTAAWCIRRAELVLKCVKGFMLETASWGGAELKNIQFLVPEGISEEVFSTLAALLPAIFRVSTPLKIKSGS